MTPPPHFPGHRTARRADEIEDRLPQAPPFNNGNFRLTPIEDYAMKNNKLVDNGRDACRPLHSAGTSV
jgi:hypothetical protein